MLFGENPKRNYKEKNNISRMCTAAKLREELFRAKAYQQRKNKGEPYEFDFKLESLLPVLNRKIPLKAHAHRLDDIFTAIRIAKEFEHCTEAYLAAEQIAKENIPLAVGPSLTLHIGVDERVGSIEIGKDADFVITEGRIFDTINNKIKYVIIDGKNIKIMNKRRLK